MEELRHTVVEVASIHNSKAINHKPMEAVASQISKSDSTTAPSFD